MKMLNWKIGVDRQFNVTTGGSSKYLKRFLSEKEMERFHSIFPNGDYEDIWDKLFCMYDYFAENAEYVAKKLGYFFDATETREVRELLKLRRSEFQN